MRPFLFEGIVVILSCCEPGLRDGREHIKTGAFLAAKDLFSLKDDILQYEDRRENEWGCIFVKVSNCVRE